MEELELVRGDFGIGLDGTPRDAGKALHRLRQAGVQALDQLLGRDEGQRFRLLLEDSLDDATLAAPGSVEIRSPLRFSLPIEILPCAPIAAASLPEDEDGLAAYAQAFPAFTAVVKRIITDTPDRHEGRHSSMLRAREGGLLAQDLYIYRAPEVTVAFYWHQAAPGSAEDHAYFTSLAGHSGSAPRVRLHGPIPGDAFQSPSWDTGRELATNILTPPAFEHPGDLATTPYQLVHITAHAAGGGAGIAFSSEITLARIVRFKHRFRSRTRIEEYIIGSGMLYELSHSPGRRMDRGPVGVLSACEGTRPSTFGNPDLIEPLLDAGYRCVVGFGTKVPGSVAHAILVEAYEHLFGGASVGRALQHARTWLLLKKNNPLGVALTSFGQTDLSLEWR